MTALGIDIGGANLKFSDGQQKHVALPFELWRGPDRLAAALSQGLTAFPECQHLAVTMTGELCDCFESRQAGVAAIVNAVADAAVHARHIRFYQTTGRFVSADVAASDWKSTAAANWHAIAKLTADRFPEARGLLLDIGSTTTDLIPFETGQVSARGRTDWERTQAAELVYCGASRTPLCTVLQEIELAGNQLGLAAEWFASVEDAFLYTGVIRERAQDINSCDGRGKTKLLSARRLARLLCSDPEEVGEDVIHQLASQACEEVLRRLGRALKLQLDALSAAGGCARIVLSGSGEWLGRELLRHVGWTGAVAQWSELYSGPASEAAAAFALARMSAEIKSE